MPTAENKQELILPRFPSYGKVSSYVNLVIFSLFFSDVFMQRAIGEKAADLVLAAPQNVKETGFNLWSCHLLFIT